MRHWIVFRSGMSMDTWYYALKSRGVDMRLLSYRAIDNHRYEIGFKSDGEFKAALEEFPNDIVGTYQSLEYIPS